MALEQTFAEACATLQGLQYYLSGVRCTVVEDKPLKGETMFVAELGHAVEDVLGWLAGALEAASQAHQAVTPRFDQEAARHALKQCHERFQELNERYVGELLLHERLDELLRLGRTRRGEWQAWAQSVKGALSGGQPQLFELERLLLRCWAELAERVSLGTVNLQATNIGQQITAPASWAGRLANRRDAREGLP